MIGRRGFLASVASLAAWPGAATASAQLSERLYSLVEHYDSLGVHRTATKGDNATSAWIARELRAAGLDVELQRFIVPLDEPLLTVVRVGDRALDAFPVWPPHFTDAAGIVGALSANGGGARTGTVSFVALPHQSGGSLGAPGIGDALDRAAALGPAAIVATTAGPTGAIIAQNVGLERRRWPMPVVLVGGREDALLRQLATAGASARLISTGRMTAEALATNVIARRAGRGPAIVVSTPKSGWFHCAGERGSGVAIFLELARHLARTTHKPLLFVATSGHEFDNRGGALFISERAPKPEQVGLWIHLGANIASNKVETRRDGTISRLAAIAAQRGVGASSTLLPAVRHAFAGQPGYERPLDLATAEAIGEVRVYRDAGYTPLLGLVGGHPLHHTPLDRAPAATSPQALAPVYMALASVVSAFN